MTQNEKKQSIVETGKGLFLERGYSGAGLKDILQQAGVPKGSFYYFFASKQAFAEAVMRSYDEQFEVFFESCFQDDRLSPTQQLRKFFDLSIRRLGLDGFRGGCLIGSIGQETGATSRELAEVADSIMGRWQKLIEDCLIRAEESRELKFGVSPSELAQFIINGWEGAMLRMRIEQSSTPLSNFVSILFAGYFKTDGKGK